MPKERVHSSYPLNWSGDTLGLMAASAAWKSLMTMGRTLSAETVLTRGPSSLQMHPSLGQEKW